MDGRLELAIVQLEQLADEDIQRVQHRQTRRPERLEGDDLVRREADGAAHPTRRRRH